MAIAKHKTHRHEQRDARALARRVQRGDRGAFELLYASYEGRLYRLCHRLTGSDAAAATLVEATFVRAFATLPEDGLDTLDIPGHLTSTARTLAYANGNGGGRWLDPIPGEHAREVGAANQRLSPRQRMTLALRDLEGRPDDEIALALGAEAGTVATLVARARLRLRSELGLPDLSGACRDRLPGLSAYLDRSLPADARAGLVTHVAGCPGCRAALFALAEATLRYRSLPVPVPPGELRTRTTIALGAVGFATRGPRALVPDPATSGRGRPKLAAAAMAVLVVLGAGVTILASRDGSGDQADRAPATRATRSADAALQTASASAAVSPSQPVASVRPPPVVRHERTGPPLPPLASAGARANRASATSTAPTSTRSSGFAAPPPPPAPAAAPSVPSPLPAPPEKPKLIREIPVQILPPVAPSPTPSPADAGPPPPPQEQPDASPATTT